MVLRKVKFRELKIRYRDLVSTVVILSFRAGQTVQTQIKLLLEEQSDQGLHCLQFHLHILEVLLYGKAWFLKF